MGKVMGFNQPLVLLGLLFINLMVLERVGAMGDPFIDYLMKVDNVPSEIEDGLFLGSFGAASNRRALKALNITHVLTVANSLPSLYPDDFIYKTIRVEDTPGVNLSRFFHESFAFIEEARKDGGRVLVHCLAGISRSATVVVGYIMNEHGLSSSEALKHVAIRRPVISPNPGFMRQLQAFEESLKGSMIEL